MTIHSVVILITNNYQLFHLSIFGLGEEARVHRKKPTQTEHATSTQKWKKYLCQSSCYNHGTKLLGQKLEPLNLVAVGAPAKNSIMIVI